MEILLPENLELKCIKTCIWGGRIRFKKDVKYKMGTCSRFDNPVLIDEDGCNFGLFTNLSSLYKNYNDDCDLRFESYFDESKLKSLLIFL